MTVQRFEEAALLKCCASKRWVEAMLALQPFQDRETMFSSADSIWWRLEPTDWLEAFSAHPTIGEQQLSGWCSQEQSAIDSASNKTLEHLKKANEEYKQRFGWIFLICATGRTAPQMLEALDARLNNGREDELRVAASEQAKITKLRLDKLLAL